MGAPKYLIKHLAVGEFLLIPWRRAAPGQPDLDQTVIHRSVRQYAKRAGKKFRLVPTSAGIKAERTL